MIGFLLDLWFAHKVQKYRAAHPHEDALTDLLVMEANRVMRDIRSYYSPDPV